MHEIPSAQGPSPSQSNIPRTRSVREALSEASPRSLDTILHEVDHALETLSDRLNTYRAHQNIDPVNPDVSRKIAQTTTRIAELMDLQTKIQSAMAQHAVPVRIDNHEIQNALQILEDN